jgi:hypothetical protein
MVVIEESSPGTHVRLSIKASVAYFEFSGRTSSASVIAGLQKFYGIPPQDRPSVLAAIAFYDRSDPSMTAMDLLTIYTDVVRSGLPADIPTAIVVPERLLADASRYTHLQLRAGVLRAAFTDRVEAKRWISDQVARLSN